MPESKLYGVVNEVITNEGEGVGNLAVCALLSPSENMPRARIVIGSNRLASEPIAGFAISVPKWRELEALVNQACIDITAACPAHGDPPPRADMEGRPQELRKYLKSRWRELNLRVKLHADEYHVADEAELIGSFLRWMDEAGLGK
jgi:hypothetical protein